MSPDGSGIAVALERPFGDNFKEAVRPVKVSRPPTAYALAIQELEANGRSGVIKYDDNGNTEEYYFHDMFVGRSLERAEKLAEELKNIFAGNEPQFFWGCTEEAYNALLNPTEDNLNAHGVSAAFMHLMNISEIKSAHLMSKVYSDRMTVKPA